MYNTLLLQLVNVPAAMAHFMDSLHAELTDRELLFLEPARLLDDDVACRAMAIAHDSFGDGSSVGRKV